MSELNLDLKSTLHVIIRECNIDIQGKHTKKPLKTLEKLIKSICGEGEDALDIYGFLMTSIRDEISNGNVVTLGDMIHLASKYKAGCS